MFEFDSINAEIVKQFFTIIIKNICEKYINSMLDIFKSEMELISDDFNNDDFNSNNDKYLSKSSKLETIINLVVKNFYSNDEVLLNIFRFNKIHDVKIFISFIFNQVYNFCWNK